MDRPLAQCSKCYTACEYRGFTTFSYWWCPKCADEPSSVKLATIRHPKGEKYGYAKGDNDIVLSNSGVYKLVYLDGAIEWYERSAGCNDIVLDGSRIRSATRLTSSDLPSGKPVQSLSVACAGALPQEGGHGARAVSNATNSVPRSTPAHIKRALNADVSAGIFTAWSYDPIKDTYKIEWTPGGGSAGVSTEHSAAEMDQYATTHPANYLHGNSVGTGGTGSTISSNTSGKVPFLATGNTGIQWGKVPPPDDEL